MRLWTYLSLNPAPARVDWDTQTHTTSNTWLNFCLYWKLSCVVVYVLWVHCNMNTQHMYRWVPDVFSFPHWCIFGILISTDTCLNLIPSGVCNDWSHSDMLLSSWWLVDWLCLLSYNTHIKVIVPQPEEWTGVRFIFLGKKPKVLPQNSLHFLLPAFFFKNSLFSVTEI